MTELLTAAQMRAIEQAVIASGDVTGLELMERAGRGVVDAILAEWPELATTPHRAVILCGPGNNGGDGFVVARLLKERGWEVEVFLYGDPAKLPPDARANSERWGASGTIQKWHRDATLPACSGADIVVDAVFGTGLSRPLPEDLRHSVPLPPRPRWIAIDILSGLDADSGKFIDPAFHSADLTVTFHAPKIGHALGLGPTSSGRLVVAPLQIGPVHRFAALESVPGGLAAFPRPLVAETRCDPSLARTRELSKGAPTILHQFGTHKYTHGHALILSGPATRTGAARLAARGALRIGAGLVTLAAPPDALTECAAQLTAIMLRALADADALADLLEDHRLNALCLGPGLGTGARARALIAAALEPTPRSGARSFRSVVLDADALTAFEDDPERLFSQLHANCVLTPHGGEFGRLFPDIHARLIAPATKGPAYSKVDATREAAARAGCTVLFKGPDTVVADQTGACRINSSVYDRAAPWLATAGSGDVLAGFVTGLLARGVGPLDAASTAAWLHTECALSFGPGLIAEDIPEEIPKVFKSLGL